MKPFTNFLVLANWPLYYNLLKIWVLLFQLYFSFMKNGTNIETDTTFVIFNEQVLLLYSNSVFVPFSS